MMDHQARDKKKPTNVFNIKKNETRRKKKSIRKVPQTHTQAFG
jgi:hypothetical protein